MPESSETPESGTSGSQVSVDRSLIRRTLECMGKIGEEAKAIRGLVKSLKGKLVDMGESTSPFYDSADKGFSLLDMKNKILLEYLESIVHLALRKSSGMSIQGSPMLDCIVESRTVLEKIRPLEQKSQYQINKLVKAAVQGKIEDDPLRYKANVNDLEATGRSDDEEEDEEETKTGDNKPEIYKPPRVAPQHFDDDNIEEGAQSAEKIRKLHFNKQLIRELQEEVLETPMEVHNRGDGYAKQLSKEKRDKQRYEETNMTRLPVTKKEKHMESRLSTLGVLGDEITDFSGGRQQNKGSNRKRKAAGKKSKGGKKRFRK